MTKFTDFNPFDYVDSNKEERELLQEAWDDEDPQAFATMLGFLIKSKGVAKIAKATGLGRTSLYKATSGKVALKLSTVRKVMAATGVEMKVVKSAVPAAKSKAAVKLAIAG